LIALGGIVKVRYRGWRGGGKITKAAVHEFVEKTLSFENSKEKFEELTLKDFIPSEKKIFSATILPQNPNLSYPGARIYKSLPKIDMQNWGNFFELLKDERRGPQIPPDQSQTTII
jgi:hypothetical protein